MADAVEAFGQIDVVVNNAGITRDRSFSKLTNEEIDAVLKVHLYGTISVTKAAWEHLQASGTGRVISTTLGARLFGNFGQPTTAPPSGPRRPEPDSGYRGGQGRRRRERHRPLRRLPDDREGHVPRGVRRPEARARLPDGRLPRLTRP